MLPVMIQRTLSGLVIGAILLGVLFWLPPSVMLIILLVLAALACHEFYALLQAANIPRYPVVGTLGGFLLLLGVWMIVAPWVVGVAVTTPSTDRSGQASDQVLATSPSPQPTPRQNRPSQRPLRSLRPSPRARPATPLHRIKRRPHRAVK